MTQPTLDEFTSSYIEAILWSTINVDHETGDSVGQYLDSDYGVEDIDPECLTKIIEECKDFQEKNKEYLKEEYLLEEGFTVLDMAGYDFWMTRSESGGGFNDGDWEKESGNILYQSAKSYKIQNFYPGGDGKIYF